MLGNNLLRGELVYLTANTLDDSEKVAEWFNNFNVATYASYHLSINNAEQQRNRFKQFWERKGFGFGIKTIADDTFIGICTLEPPDWRIRKALLGITIGETDYWGQGYGTDATLIMLRYAFLELNMNRVELGVFDYNTRAIRAYEKIGFVHEGARRQCLYRDGEYHDIFHMAILRAEWEALYHPNA